jgi:hypothetical protein
MLIVKIYNLENRTSSCDKPKILAKSSILPSINKFKEKENSVNVSTTRNNNISTSNNIKTFLEIVTETKPKKLKLTRKETHHKNLDFIKKLSQKIEVIKIRPSTISPDADRNSIERQKLVKQMYGKHDKKKTENVFFYNIIQGNNSSIIRKCMMTRENWREDLSGNFHFRWQQTSAGIDFTIFNKFSIMSKVHVL